MKRFLFILSLMSVSIASIDAEPVEPGVWKRITLTDKTEVMAELQGDEHFSFYKSSDGRFFVPASNGTYMEVSPETITVKASAAQEIIEMTALGFTQTKSNVRRAASKIASSTYSGTKKGLVLLVQFSDVKFSSDHNQAFYRRFCNEPGFDYSETANGKTYQFVGSVKDYYLDQSNNKFELDFDVVGPYTVSQTRDYYGKQYTTTSGTTYHDGHLGYMAYEALQQAYNDGVDFSKYDWDGDGEVEQFFVVFAGQGQADGGSDNCIWPTRTSLTNQLTRETTLSRVSGFTKANYSVPTYNNVKVDVFACSQELKSLKDDDGTVVATCINSIGTFCHEFSHCLGLKDHYQTTGSANGVVYGPGYWDIMCYGGYNATTFIPAAYNAYERWFCGWLEPLELTDPQQISKLAPLSEGGDAYVIFCKGNDITGEYYLIENRQNTGWDTALPHHGMLITHVNYNASNWSSNKVNTVLGQEGINLFFAGGESNRSYGFNAAYPWDPQLLVEKFPTYGSTPEEVANYMSTNLSLSFGTTYNNALMSSTSPSATYFNGGTSNQAFDNHEITNIKENGDVSRTMSFTYRNYQPEIDADYLVQTQWGQGGGLTPTTSIWRTALSPEENYNMYCTYKTIKPSSSTREKYSATYYSVAGNAATAMAQIVNYHFMFNDFSPELLMDLPTDPSTDASYYDWSYTTPGGSFYTLTTEDAGNQSTDGSNSYTKGASFDFEQITSGDMSSIAKLIRACGLASLTEYTAAGGTHCDIAYVVPGLRDVFGFDSTIKLVERSGYEDEEWQKLLVDEIDAKRPLIIYGKTESDAEHIFIIDGYNDGLFHVNMGYEGNGDGWYSIDEIPCPSEIGDGTLSYEQKVVIGIQVKEETKQFVYFTVTFETGGGTAIEQLSVEEGTAVTRPADPTREGFTFDGWYSDETLTTEYDFSQPVTADLTVYAKWEKVVITCATPVLAWENGRVTATCETEDVTYHYAVQLTADGTCTDGLIPLEGTATFTVYASKEDYLDSEAATIVVKLPQVGDVNGDGSVTIADVTALVDILLGK